MAITVVLIEHFGSYLANFFLAGYYGVDLFFVISGYLITSILIKDHTESFSGAYRNFIGRRILRIFPVYYLTIAVLVLYDFPSARDMFPWLASYTYNFGVVLIQGADEEAPLFYLWSLSVEEQFYLFWPFLAISLKGRKDVLLLVTLGIVLVSYAQLTFNIFPSISKFNYTGLPNRMGSLGLGALGAVFVSWKGMSRESLGGVRFEAAVLLLLVLSLTLEFRLRFVTMGLCSLYLVLKAAGPGFRIGLIDRFLLNRMVIYIGSISYGIYLFHVPIGDWLTKNLFDPVWLALPWESFGQLSVLRWHSWVVKLPLYTALVVALAGLSYRWFESPILSYKDRWFRYERNNG